MRSLLLFAFVITFGMSGVAVAQGKSTDSDRVLIEQTIENWNQAWKVKDFKLATRDYSDDADWTNAFGQKAKGRAAIEKVLAEVFALPFVMAGDSKTVEQTIRFIKPDVALVVTRVERAGQETASGGALGLRHTSHHRVLVRTGKQWHIVSHLISDARDMVQPKH